MPDSELLLDLLVRWEDLRRQGKAATPEELCPDDPQLREALRLRIRKRQRIDAILQSPTRAETAGPDRPPPVPNIEGYEVVDLLGRGGMGVVYKARQAGLNRLVALKMVLSGASAGPRELGRFRTEAEAVARLQHPGIVQIYDVGEQAGCPYLALEFVPGGSLADALDGTPLPARRAAQLVLALARAVHHAHQQGIIHRDLKPANVLLTPDGVPKVTDFGLAKLRDSDTGYTQTGAILGSPSYMAPEQAEARTRDVGPATDIYALGAILYELLTGRPPFKAATLLETLEQVRANEPVPPRRLQPGVPRDLETVCLKCLQKSPADRYASAEALAEDLNRFLEDEPISARSLTLFDRVTRAIHHTRLDTRIRSVGTTALLTAPVPFLAQLALVLLAGREPYYPLASVVLTLATILTILTLIFGGNRATLRQLPNQERQHTASVWAGHTTAVLLVLLVCVLMAPPDRPANLFLPYPLWATLAGATFFSMASNAGLLYLIGTACFALAAVMAWHPSWAPLEAGLLMSVNLLAQGLYYRRVGSEAGAGTDGTSSLTGGTSAGR
jgi:serine/threonine protein kinase